jgi:hypothetical protein
VLVSYARGSPTRDRAADDVVALAHVEQPGSDVTHAQIAKA